MKRVLILRHAKSDWKAEFDADHDRPLAPRGRGAAMLIGRVLARIGQTPDLVISSSATRAEQTVRLASEAGAWSCPIEISPLLYQASESTLLGVLQQQDDALDSLLLAGHEPTCSEFVGRAVGAAQVKFPTACLARVDFPVDFWRQARFEQGLLTWLVTPKLLQRAGLDEA